MRHVRQARTKRRERHDPTTETPVRTARLRGRRPSTAPRTIAAVREITRFHGPRLTVDQIVAAMIARGHVVDGDGRQRRRVRCLVRSHLAGAELGSIQIEGLL